MNNQEKSNASGLKMKDTNDDVQRAIEGLKEIPDDELQEFLDEEDFMEGLDVVDAWDGEEDRQQNDGSNTNVKIQEQKRQSRENHQNQEISPHQESKSKKTGERRDPTKSSKDIERDKIRMKKDSENKLLAEKEKAIKHLLDSDNVVPPGTEGEVLETITEKQNQEKAQQRNLIKNKEKNKTYDRKSSPSRRRSVERRTSPYRRRNSFAMSPERKKSPLRTAFDRLRSSPIKSNQDRKRSPIRYEHRSSDQGSSERRKRSQERRGSIERHRRRFDIHERSPIPSSPERKIRSSEKKWSSDRQRRRLEVYERRRSRSRDRQRSRSSDRFRRRTSRSPLDRRYSPRRRSRSHSRSQERRVRKRSPFINELARTFAQEAARPVINAGYPTPGASLQSLPAYNPEPIRPQPPSLMQSFMSGPGIMQSSYMNFETSHPPSLMTFDPMSIHTAPPGSEYTAGSTAYNSGPMLPMHSLSSNSPQPVPAPMPMNSGTVPYDSTMDRSISPRHSPSRSSMSFGTYQPYVERLKTPEPPVISNSNSFLKTSLSSLLEASVSAKDSTNMPILHPGLKSEILQQCARALRELPVEDPRLKMRGRFFYDPKKEDKESQPRKHQSNSILLQTSVNKLNWDDEQVATMNGTRIAPISTLMHQKICQTDEVEVDTKYVQTCVITVDAAVQVHPYDLEPSEKDEKKPIMDRLDWNIHNPYEYPSHHREPDDLRWSLNNSSQRHTWVGRRSEERESRHPESNEYSSSHHKTPETSRSYSGQASFRDRYSIEHYSPDEIPLEESCDEYRDHRSDHSRGESPMVLVESEEESDSMNTFQKKNDWSVRGNSARGKGVLNKMQFCRGKFSVTKPHRGRGSFRGKY